MSYVDDDFLAILNDVEAASKEADEEIEAAGEMGEDIIENLAGIFEHGEDIGIDSEDLKVIMEARSTVHIKPEIIDRIFQNFKPEFWLQAPVVVDKALEVIRNAQNVQSEYV